MRVGIIGCGNISETYFECQNLFNNFTIVACADINIEAAKNSAEKYNVKFILYLYDLVLTSISS